MFIVRALYEKVSDFTFDPWRIPNVCTPLDDKWEWKKETYNQLFKKIKSTKLPDTFKYGRLNILVIGPKSHGKSSFINTVASLSAKEETSVTIAGSKGESETVTTVFRHLDIPGSFKCLRLCDVPGLTTQESAETLVKNLKSIVDGHIKSGYKFDDKEPISAEDAKYYMSEPTTENKIHGVIIVFDITETYEIHIRHRTSLASITKKLYEMNIPISVILTKADKLDPLVKKNMEKIYYSKRVLTAVENMEKFVGVPMMNIHPVVNCEFGWKNALPILVAVRACLSMASSHLFCELNEEKREADEKKEADERKKQQEAEGKKRTKEAEEK